jgi:hypothetical protein
MSFRLPKHQPAPLRGSIGRSPLFPSMLEPESPGGVLRQGVNEQQSRSSYVGETSLTRSRTTSEFGTSRTITVTSERHSMKQKDQWLEAARKSTEHFRKHGSAVPLVWVRPIILSCDLDLTFARPSGSGRGQLHSTECSPFRRGSPGGSFVYRPCSFGGALHSVSASVLSLILQLQGGLRKYLIGPS